MGGYTLAWQTYMYMQPVDNVKQYLDVYVDQ